MKSDRRHELQENELASYLGRVTSVVEPYAKLLAVVLAAVVLAVVGFAIYQSQTSATRSDATLQLIEATANSDPEVLADVANRYSNTAAGAWARLYQGTQYMATGMSALYNDPQNAEQQFEQARRALRQALDQGDDRVLRSRAHFGLARIAEARGEIDEAIDAYREVAAINESEAMVNKAQQRIEALSNPQTQEFLAWFNEQDFAPADPSMPPSLPSDSALPDLPDVELPELGDQPSPSQGTEGETPLRLQDALNLQETDPEMAVPSEEPARADPTPADPAQPTDDPTAPPVAPSQPSSDGEASEPTGDAPNESEATEPSGDEAPADPQDATEEPDAADSDTPDSDTADSDTAADDDADSDVAGDDDAS